MNFLKVKGDELQIATCNVCRTKVAVQKRTLANGELVGSGGFPAKFNVATSFHQVFQQKLIRALKVHNMNFISSKILVSELGTPC